ncbi:hypothetical protein CHS0354_036268 [Potamilus streckersoni]|uniref:Uncharacterized protein n=1 Tax=Potamilus streckersoni TaxID=2493646 RepID=A0AAE0W2E3_9BIVA|nr:hypothetical protein CHS0354_036268 [Potamilus streckersoni]
MMDRLCTESDIKEITETSSTGSDITEIKGSDITKLNDIKAECDTTKINDAPAVDQTLHK